MRISKWFLICSRSAGLGRPVLIEGYECVGHGEINNMPTRLPGVHNPSEKEWYAKDARTIEPGDMRF